MESILKFDAIKKALETVVAESDVNNGTRGMELYCYYWSHDYQYDKIREDLKVEMGTMSLLGKVDEVIRIRAEIEKLPKPKIIMEFRLMTPIPLVRGTKTIEENGKRFTISATDVKTILIPEDSLYTELAEFEETTDMATDSTGTETPIIKLKIKKGLLDVAPEKLDRTGKKVLQPKKVYLVAVSYKTLQVVGMMKVTAENARKRRFGFDEQL